MKNYFTEETSVFVEKNLQKFRFLFCGKDRFVIRNTSVNTENEFCRLKEYFIFEMVFYGGNLCFCREKLVEIPVFIRWKRPFRNKKYKC